MAMKRYVQNLSLLSVELYYWHKVKHILKFWYKFSNTLNQANLFYFFRTKVYLDPTIVCSYS